MWFVQRAEILLFFFFFQIRFPNLHMKQPICLECSPTTTQKKPNFPVHIDSITLKKTRVFSFIKKKKAIFATNRWQGVKPYMTWCNWKQIQLKTVTETVYMLDWITPLCRGLFSYSSMHQCVVLLVCTTFHSVSLSFSSACVRFLKSMKRQWSVQDSLINLMAGFFSFFLFFFWAGASR